MIEDLNLVRDYSILKLRKIIVCGSKDSVRKAGRLSARAGIEIDKIYCDEVISDDELSEIEKAEFDAVFSLKNKESYNIIYAENDQEIFDKNLVRLDEDSTGHIFTYCGLYMALSINAKKDKAVFKDMVCMNELNAAVGIYDLAARWLRGIRWVEESGINVLLYAMPKTGTQSMKATLNKYGIEHTYIHFLNLFSSLNKQFYDYYGEKVPCLAELLDDPQYVKDHYLNILTKNKKLKIITSVREPIARNYSMIFQAIRNWGPYQLVCHTDGDFEQGVIDYLEHCSTSTWDWFDEEIKEVFGIDVYQYPFDKEKGYATIKEGNVQIFLYKLESSRDIGKALGKFLGFTKNMDLLLCHESEKEKDRFIYKQLKQELHLPEKLISKNYNNDRMRHFYTEKEILKFREQWI